MDQQAEWFLSLGLGFKGPFTTDEVKRQLARAEVGRENLVWADGMHDWQPLAKVDVFKTFALSGVPFVHESPWMEEGEREFSAIFTDFKKSLSPEPVVGPGAKLGRFFRRIFSK